jgi:DNA ligase-1
MDGVRAYRSSQILLSRHGNIIHCPKWFTSKLPPDTTLDGELWLGKNTTFEDINSVLRSKNNDWSSVGYYVFDCPSFIGNYGVRMKHLEALASILPPHVHLVENRMCTGKDHLYEYPRSILEDNGEGLILREPRTEYTPGVTTSLLKVKVSDCTLGDPNTFRNLKTPKWKF